MRMLYWPFRFPPGNHSNYPKAITVWSQELLIFVMRGLDPRIHVFFVVLTHENQTWMPVTSTGMTVKLVPHL